MHIISIKQAHKNPFSFICYRSGFSFSFLLNLLSFAVCYLWWGWKTWAANLSLSLVGFLLTRLVGPNIIGWCLCSWTCEAFALPSITSWAKVAHVIGAAGFVYRALDAASRCQASAFLARSSRIDCVSSFSPPWKTKFYITSRVLTKDRNIVRLKI